MFEGTPSGITGSFYRLPYPNSRILSYNI